MSWILIDDKLPPDREEVLLHCKEEQETFVGYLSSHNDDNKPRFYATLTDDRWEVCEIKRWHFLPEGEND